jgi:hypothetical protein
MTKLILLLVSVSIVGMVLPLASSCASGRIIDGAAIGYLVTDQPPDSLVRFLTLTMFVSNDCPADTNDTIYEIDLTNGGVIASFPAPCKHPQGLVTWGLVGEPIALNLIVAEDDPADTLDLLYVMSPYYGTVVDSFPASGVTASLSPRALVESMTAVGIVVSVNPDTTIWYSEIITEVWIANGDTLCLIDVADGSCIRTIPSPCSSPQGLETGRILLETSDLWVVCDDTDSLYLIDTADGRVIRSIPAPCDHASGLALSLIGSTVPLEYDGWLLSFWQGENTSDTMEELAPNGAFIRRIWPVCPCPCGGIDRHFANTFCLAQNRPNPFGTATSIAYDLPVDCHVKLDVYDVSGRRVATIVNEYRPAGRSFASWDGRNASGTRVSEGIYFYRMQAGGFAETKRMVLLK